VPGCSASRVEHALGFAGGHERADGHASRV
jgi:hypothetical protein